MLRLYLVGAEYKVTTWGFLCVSFKLTPMKSKKDEEAELLNLDFTEKLDPSRDTGHTQR